MGCSETTSKDRSLRRSFAGAAEGCGLLIFEHEKRPAWITMRAFCITDSGSVLAVLIGHRQQLFFLIPVERFVVLFGFETTLFQSLIQVDFVIGHVMQAVAGEVPQQVARDQVGNLRVTGDDLAQDVLAQVLAFDRVDRQQCTQFVEALQEQGMAFFGNLFGLTHGDQDAAQVVKQDEMVGNDIGHEISPQEQNGRRSIKLLRPFLHRWLDQRTFPSASANSSLSKSSTSITLRRATSASRRVCASPGCNTPASSAASMACSPAAGLTWPLFSATCSFFCNGCAAFSRLQACCRAPTASSADCGR